jgi:dipeptidyl aminopeptidase/acylaminoacyl peptidase
VSEPVPCGAWPSQITADRVVEASVRLGEVRVGRAADGTESIWWSETRPTEAGRTQVVRRAADGDLRDVLPGTHSASTRVHEYGGGAWWLDGDSLCFVEDRDQRIWRLDPGGDPWPLTPRPPTDRAWRYADGTVTPDGWIVCVQEVHEGDSEAVNRLVAVPARGGAPVVLFDGSDFVSSPRHDPATGLLAFLTWDHPDMPWDATRLWVGQLDLSQGDPRLVDPEVVAGGAGESVCQPGWDPDGRLWFVSDRTGWWNLYRGAEPGRPAGEPRPIDPGEWEVGEPAWVFGQSRYDFLSDGRVVFARRSSGRDQLAVVTPSTGEVEPLDVPSTEISNVRATATTAVYVGAAFTSEPAVQALLVGRDAAVGGLQVLRPPRDLGLGSVHLSAGRHISFPTAGGQVAHAIYYEPRNPDALPEEGERPPLIVMIHGGPTANARAELRLALQYWTSRGFSVVDVDYRGSTGYGRRYRDELRGEWGVADVEDCVAAATYLADEGHVDRDRLLIRGGSAGGFTTLAALAFTDVFAAGASYYGVADLALLATETHKFEARYLDGLVGPYPEEAARYQARSPLTHVERIDAPVIVFQGTEDRVVPPNQATEIVDALARKGIPHSYLPIAGEGHGFRKAPNIKRTLEAEHSFYLQVLGIPHPEDLPRVEVLGG